MKITAGKWAFCLLAPLYLHSTTNSNLDVAHFLLSQSPNESEILSQLSALTPESLSSINIDINNENLRFWASHGYAKAQFLAYQKLDDVNGRQLLRSSAESGYAPAQYEWSKLSESETQQEYWLKLSAEGGYDDALLDYSAVLFHRRELKQVEGLLRPYMQRPEIALRSVIYFLRHGNYTRAREVLDSAALKKSKIASYLLAVLDDTQFEGALANLPLDIESLSQGLAVDGQLLPTKIQSECGLQIQPMGTGLMAMEKAKKLVNQFQSDERFSSLPVCFSDPVWISDDDAQCVQTNSSQRIRCDVKQIAAHLNDEQWTHWLIIHDQGKANVDSGVMYLDLEDTYQVFIHELTHFFGLVDEYPLSSNVAKQVCTKTENGRFGNIRFTHGNESPVAPFTIPARTCDNSDVQAWKSSEQLTLMEYFETDYLPSRYIEIMKEVITERSYFFPVHYNLYHQALAQRDEQQAEYWLKRWNVLKNSTVNESNITFSANSGHSF